MDEIATSREWRSLLLYSPRLLRAPSGIVDSEAFYLHPDGAADPRAELQATLARFQSEEGLTGEDPNGLARCKFPARYRFLKAKVPGLGHSHLECPWIKDYFQAVEPQGVSLVFSSFYLNNPSSMMGHTFIRFHRQAKSGEMRTSYLDYVVNFAANPTTSNPLLYTFSGLFGRFPGTFGLLPYYLKIGEYVNQESRDLWEYELDLSAEEVLRLFLSVLEVGQHYVNYFYIDENCSYLMLFLLDAARPSLGLKSQFHGIVTPTDTLRAVQQSGLVKSIRMIPSQRGRFQSRYDLLSESARRVVRDLAHLPEARFDESAAGLLSALSEQEQVDALDTFLEYIGFVEKLAGEKKPVRFRTALRKTLEWRAQHKVAAKPVESEPRKDLQPHLAHASKRVLLGARQLQGRDDPSARDGYLVLGLRPSLHDAETVSGGFPGGVGIELGNTLLGIRQKDSRLELLQFRLVDIRSTQAQSFSNRTPSWGLALGYDVEPLADSDEIHLNGSYFFSGSVGLSTPLFSERQMLSLMVYPELHLRPWNDETLNFDLYAGPDMLVYLGASTSLSIFYHAGFSSRHDPERYLRRYGTSARIYLPDGWEMGLKASLEKRVISLDAHVGFFF